uniref:Ammonium transporter n=1 Tax=Compsopogon caeruleus TaxID=31354 RepID=A0A7S1T8N8_9RHOD|mmetsp:Transcript_13209/g.26807  ORF Transcript_13209/g.26807 Transcript_13209/m.26807 type:complete len:525 (+) Transcript_13209:147-1721(+)
MRGVRLGTVMASSFRQMSNCTDVNGTYLYNVSTCFPQNLATENAPTTDVELLQTALNSVFISISGYLVFLMQTGFAMLTAGSVRTKNTKNVLIKNFLDACVGAMAWYFFGYAFAFGDKSNEFIGYGNFAMSGLSTSDFHSWFFQWAFAATAATIVSGSVAERTSFYAYLGYAFFLTAFVYPVVVHWAWSTVGWFSTSFGEGSTYLDFAGSGVVHMVGGFAGLVGAIIVGPRLGRFDAEGKVVPMPGHSATLCTLGTFILWFGWYGFNPGSTLGAVSSAISESDLSDFPTLASGELIGPNLTNTFQRAIVTTTLAGAAAGVTTLIAVKFRDHIFDLISCLNGTLAGLVAVTASCAWIEPWAAIVIGIIGAIVYMVAAWLLLKLKIDDPLEAFPIHGACGLWGVLAVGVFVREEYLIEAGYSAKNAGFLYGSGGKQLGIQIACALGIMVWVTTLIGLFFMIFKLAGLLRISAEEELLGNDVSKHGGSAYPEDALANAEIEAQKELDAFRADNFGQDESIAMKDVEV